MTVGEKIKNLRKKAGFTQVQLAEKANMSRSYLADVERDRYNPSVATLNALAEALNVKVSEIISGDEEENNDWDSTLPELTEKDEQDIAKDIERIINKLGKDGYAAFDGEDPVDEEDKELLIASLENSMRLAKRMAKQKFTPKKYRR